MTRPARGWRQLLCGAIAVALLTGGGVADAEPIAGKRPSVAVTADQVAGFVAEASQRFGIPASWIRAVMRAESFGDVRALSPKGAMGLMQIMPATWAGLRLRYGLGADPYNARDNIIAGAAYLRELHDRYGAPGFLAAYNAGPARYEDHLATGRPLPAETRAYVALLAPQIGGGSVDDAMVVAVLARSWTQAPLFAASAESSPTHAQPSSALPSGQPSIGGAAEDWTALAPQSDGLFVRTSGRNPRP
jgi:membrane-bound lytic murein transglycosylase B